MTYIISKIDVKDLKAEIIYSADNEDDCKAKLLDLTQANDNINKIIENDYIMSYEIKKGYLYSTKRLLYIYQILQIPENVE